MNEENGGNGENGTCNQDFGVEGERLMPHLEVDARHYSPKAEIQKLIAQVAQYNEDMNKKMAITTYWVIALFIAYGALVLTVVGLMVSHGFSEIIEMLR